MRVLNRFQPKTDFIGSAVQYLLAVVFGLFLIVVQTTIVHAASVFHVVPGLVFVFCMCYSIKKGGLPAVVLSAACGFLLDMLNGRPQGLDALLYLYISLGCVTLHDCLYNKSLKVLTAGILTASVVYGAATFGLNFLLWEETRIGFAFTHKIIPEALYNCIVTPILYPFVCKCSVSKDSGRSVCRE